MVDVLDQCIESFGPAPRRFTLWQRWTYYRVPRPSWLRDYPADALSTVFRHARKTFEEGVVVWGCVVQANQLLFERGHDNCPAEVVYSLEPRRSVDPQALQAVADRLYALKGTTPANPDLARLAEYLTDEWTRVFGMPVPSILSPAFSCQMSTSLILRKHLPKRRLCSPLLPLVVNPQPPLVAFPLPARFWPRDFIDAWVESRRP